MLDLLSTATGTTTTAPAPARAAAPATAVPPTTTPPVAEEVPAPPAGLALVDQTDWLATGTPFDLRVALADDLGPETELVVEVHGPITSRSQFTATLGGALLGARRATATVPLGELAVGTDGSRSVRLTQGPTSAAGERPVPVLARPGVYPVVVSVRPGDPSREPPAPFTTYLVRTPDESTPLRVAVVQPVDAPLLHGPNGDVTVAPEVVGDLLAVAEVLAASAPMPLTIAPRPETLDGLDELAVRDPGAAGVLEALTTAAAGRQVVSAPYVDVDVDALEAAGLGEDVAAQRRRGDDAVEEVLGVRTDPRTAVLDGGAGGGSLRRLATLGVDQVVLPDASLTPVTLRLSLTRPFSVSADDQGVAIDATAPEPALAARYGRADAVLASQHLLADLAVLHGDEPGPLQPRGVVVAPPDDVDVDPGFLANLLDGIGSSPTLEPVTLDTYFRDVTPEGEGAPLVRGVTASGGTLGISAREVEAARSSLAGYASMVEGQDAVVQDLHDLTLLAEADGLEPAGRRAYLAGVGTSIESRVGRVGLLEGTDFRLPDSEGTIPLTLVRDGTTPLTVRVMLESERLEFGSGDELSVGRRSYDDIELTSESTPLVVPVHVRSPGTFPLFVTITSPDGRLELARSEVTIRSTAYSGVGVALSVGAGLFLLLWWGRHWRTVRRARRLVPVA